MSDDAKIVSRILARLASEMTPFYVVVAREIGISCDEAQHVCRRFGFNVETGKRVEAQKS